ncbi:kinesin family protein [Niveomyces insectorum RCEF 264]|uniref:Kinesin family protein n=1 Tax=Niveomyces insectorum RCEF 264 TaxID=1081102 RepID=A0A167Y0R3_9HYPO|nr:kinesin family protein [Niveomyces insectorum RCEF 264]
MDAPSSPSKSHNLFQVYLRLRPPQAGAAAADRFLEVEPPATDAPSTAPTHIRLNPPNDRRRAIEKFCFTRVFEEEASQLDVFHSTGVVPLVEGVLAPHGGEGTDALLATLGVTGSGKSHTILGSRSQRGLTQLTLDVLFRSIGENIADWSAAAPTLEASINASDASEATIYTASAFVDSVYGDGLGQPSQYGSRAPTPMIVRPISFCHVSTSSPTRARRPQDEGRPHSHHSRHSSTSSSFSGLPMPGMFPTSPSGLPRPQRRPDSVRVIARRENLLHAVVSPSSSPSSPNTLARPRSQSRSKTERGAPFNTRETVGSGCTKTPSAVVKHCNEAATHASSHQPKAECITKPVLLKGEYSNIGAPPPPTPRRYLNRPSVFPQQPDVSSTHLSSDSSAQYAVLISMYEVYNDRIFDLLTPPIKSAATKEYRRRPLLFKSTELSPDRKVVAGLRKVICSTLNQALLVLEAGLHERRVAGTGSNSASSRSHGFVSIEVKKRPRSRHNERAPWSGTALTVVDLAGSERARDAKTAGATLAEAGKINESLMYLGQCLQMQSDMGSSSKPNVVPFRQCKLTELLFSNSFPSASMVQSSQLGQSVRRNPQKAVMIVTADPHGDFNATSQILRYSALAREITVPRIPSITQTLMATTNAQQAGMHSGLFLGSSPPSSTISNGSSSGGNGQGHGHGHGNGIQHHRPFFPPGSNTTHVGPHHARTFSPCSNASSEDRVTMEIAALEIARMSEEIDYLRASLEQESERRLEAESRLLSLTDRVLELEQEIREDCAAEFEQRLVLEMARWKAGLEVEKERGEEHWDRKVEVMERLQSAAAETNDAADYENKENVLVENLEEENERLRQEIQVLKRELTSRSPTKRKPLRERDDVLTVGSAVSTPASASAGRGVPKSTDKATGGDSLRRKMERLRVSDEDDTAMAAAIMGRSSNRPSGASVKSVASRSGSPKKIRKLSPRKWDVALDDDDLF